jgi:hypothetical protein
MTEEVSQVLGESFVFVITAMIILNVKINTNTKNLQTNTNSVDVARKKWKKSTRMDWMAKAANHTHLCVPFLSFINTQQRLLSLSFNVSQFTCDKFYLISKMLPLVNTGAHSKFLPQDCYRLKT